MTTTLKKALFCIILIAAQLTVIQAMRRGLFARKEPQSSKTEVENFEEELRTFFKTKVADISEEFHKSLKSEEFKKELGKKKQKHGDLVKKSQQRKTSSKSRASSGGNSYNSPYKPQKRSPYASNPYSNPGGSGGYGSGYGGGYTGGGFGNFGRETLPSILDQSPFKDHASPSKSDISSRKNPTEPLKDTHEDKEKEKTMWRSGSGASKNKNESSEIKTLRNTVLSKQEAIRKKINEINEEESKDPKKPNKPDFYHRVIKDLPKLEKDYTEMNDALSKLEAKEQSALKLKITPQLRKLFPILLKSLPVIAENNGSKYDVTHDNAFKNLYQAAEETIDKKKSPAEIAEVSKKIISSYTQELEAEIKAHPFVPPVAPPPVAPIGGAPAVVPPIPPAAGIKQISDEAKVKKLELEKRINTIKSLVPSLTMEALEKKLATYQ